VEGQTIALAAIVKNERPILERMFASVENIIDTWVIIDTGSTDGTVEYLQERQDGRLEQHPWVDFGTNRTQLMQSAQGVADYLLLLDADMTIEQRSPLPFLTEDAYFLEHIKGLANCWLPRLVKGDREWRFTGKTHEFLEPTWADNYTGELVDALKVVHHEDGASRSIKFERDIELLTQDFRDTTSSDLLKQRSAFYLATTYDNLGEELKALYWFEKRVKLGGENGEEVFLSQFHVGRILDSADEIMKSWMMRPSRAEPLALLAQRWNLRQDFQRAYYAAKAGLALGYPSGDTNFVYPAPYQYDLWFQLSVAAYNIGKTEEAIDAAKKVLRRNPPPHIRTQVEHNLEQLV
jgi:glycosyltransferase involved in cell wall biosynthesis